MDLQQAASIARRLNPTVIDRGEWPGLGRMYNVVMSNGDQTSIVVEPGGDLDKKVAETIGRFEAPPKCGKPDDEDLKHKLRDIGC